MSVAQLALYGLLVFLFFTPFITVSCDDAVTEPISGFELASGQDPTILGSSDESTREDIMEVVDGTRRMAIILVALLVGGISVALASVFRGPRPGISRAHFACSYLTAFGYFAFVLGAGQRALGPDVHHASGANGSAALSALALIPAFATLRLALAPCQPAGRWFPAGIAVWMACGGWLLFGAAVRSESSAVLAAAGIVWFAAAAVGLLAVFRRGSIAGLVASLVAGLPLSAAFGMLVTG